MDSGGGTELMSKQSNNGRQQLAKYTITEVFEYVDASPKNGQKIKFHGHSMHLRSTRLLNFRINGIKCIRCDIQGAYFAKERYDSNAPHLNLYGFNKHGHPMLITRDHIKPKAKGGTNHLYNSQTMCAKCNSSKGDAWTLKARTKYIFNRMKSFIIKKITNTGE